MQITSDQNEAEQALTALGFTDLEARVYCALLASGPATGYRLAKLVGKAPPNVYQALAALGRKAAVLVDETEPRTWRAARPAELLAVLGGSFAHRQAEAERRLANLAVAPADDRLYQIADPDQVLERARAMLAAAKDIVLFDLFDAPLAALREPLEATAARGVTVAGLVYGPVESIAGVIARRAAGEGVARDRWPGAQLSLVVDAAEHLVALMTPAMDGVRRAIWSDSAYLSCLQHSGLSAEIRLTGVASDALEPLAGLSLLRAAPRGLRALIGPEPLSLSLDSHEVSA
ncbi:TrmB family transcriptional regulator [Brevundimonas sp.]|uniref:TrmB family transcriptional regulator n=1 Tax=Brevundimonas sp. TaxID=1871086 RepID=UPI002D59D8AF|nr:helix-turn-helix domain-containing protein [Brevundimonas sp.]HYC67769.1 helix-turn-helix domain-containing protein [Brevundimonas sp.]